MQKKLWLILLYSAALSAKDLGTFGETFPIVEENLLSFIQGKLSQLQSSGEIQKHQEVIAKKVVKNVQRPLAVEGVVKTKEPRKFYYDPSITIPYDLKDHNGVIFHKAGTTLNPLEVQPLKHSLFFIDGDDIEQINWTKKHINTSPKIILVRGAPFELMKTLETTVYFDQGGSIVKKLGIKQVPARVDQEGKTLVISEILLEEEQ
jgi:conjugal transfer pilus assembly protein TraW